MALLVDLFGYLGIILHGLAIIGQSMALGGLLFLLLLAHPFTDVLGADIARRTARIAALAAAGLAMVEATNLDRKSVV